MGEASFAQTSFLGGEWAQSMQGRIERPDYRTAMNVCLNGMPVEQGAWYRRSGTRQIAHTRGGAAGRGMSFDFKESSPYSMEFTNGFLRFVTGVQLVKTNDARAVTSISSANPAKVLTGTHGWATGNQVMFDSLGVNNPLLQNRQFSITVTSGTEFTLTDALTGATIDGATLGAFVSGNVRRILEIATPYVGGSWATLRSVPTYKQGTNSSTTQTVLLQAAVKPYVLEVTQQPSATEFAEFSFGAANFKDGPYFDLVPGGTLATPSALIGVITLTLSFNAYDATKAYSIGDYVTSGGVNYKSLVDANVGSAPPSANWVATSAADAIGPNGFQASDVGRHVRMHSEPALWAIGPVYTAGTSIVSYAGVYWKCLTNNTGATTNTPSTSPTIWALFPSGALWTWGKITGLSNIIDRNLAGSANLGNMTAGGGLAASFDGIVSQIATASSTESASGGAIGALITTVLISSYVGKNYSAATDQVISQAIVYPASDVGLVTHAITPSSAIGLLYITLNLRGKASAPASPSDGTLLATSGATGNTTSPVTLISTDQVTAWKYVWVEQTLTLVTNDEAGAGGSGEAVTSWSVSQHIAELSFFKPTGTGTSQGVTVQIVGDALLHTTPIREWRLGLFSDTTGWPTCGTFHEGRLWLSGAVGNRIDASKSNDVLNFAPTGPDGTVAGNNAISYTFNAPKINPIFWMQPDYHGIVCGTQAGEGLVQATTQNLPLTPTNIQAHLVTENGCANVEPCRADLTTAIVQRYKRDLLEYFADVYSGKFTAQNLSYFHPHLTKSGIEEVAYQRGLAKIIWQRMGDGSLLGTTYRRESLISAQPPEIRGAHRHVLGSAHTVDSIWMGANSDGTLDALMMVTNNAVDGIRHIEVLSNFFDEKDALADAFFLDDAIVPTSYEITGSPATFKAHGLWGLNGKTVTVFAGGLDCGEVTVSNGTATVTFGDGAGAGTGGGLFTAAYVNGFAGAMKVVVGFTYTSDGQIVRPMTPVESGARTGPAIGKTRRLHDFSALLLQAKGVSFGTRFTKLRPAAFKSGGGITYTPLQLFSGIYMSTVEDDYSFDGMLCWRQVRPYPLIVAAAQSFLHTQD